eukprot:gnl/MRDRNA2_/MRDRNA2_97976_c0_seq1.p1 gnl/MRDRNA2_/MRDRNA2_97976_c0~~gnl/MRDRNA2_/MRDRNA2_97976_c0_seq1.p1  ORF type:complete len:480 (-),score=51.83 gnl/MRDRNA2_/MRDRNA2_97976_c0_seq1:309-1748(-)
MGILGNNLYHECSTPSWSPEVLGTIREMPAAGVPRHVIPEELLMPGERQTLAYHPNDVDANVHKKMVAPDFAISAGADGYLPSGKPAKKLNHDNALGDLHVPRRKKQPGFDTTMSYVDRPERKSVAGKPSNKIEGTVGMRISSKARHGTQSTPNLCGAGMASTQLARTNTVLDIPHTRRLGPIGENRPADPDAAGVGHRGINEIIHDGQKMLKARPEDARKTQIYLTDEPLSPREVVYEEHRMLKPRPKDARKTQLGIVGSDPSRVHPRSPRCSANSESASNASRTTASSCKSSGRRSSPRQSHDGGSSSGFSYLSASSRSERRLRDSLPRSVASGVSKASTSVASQSTASSVSADHSSNGGSRRSLASSASEKHFADNRGSGGQLSDKTHWVPPLTPRQEHHSPRGSYAGHSSAYSGSSYRNQSTCQDSRSPLRERVGSPRSSYADAQSTYSCSSTRNRSPSTPRHGQMWDFFGGQDH